MSRVGPELNKTGTKIADGLGFMQDVCGKRTRPLLGGYVLIARIQRFLPGIHRHAGGFQFSEHFGPVLRELFRGEHGTGYFERVEGSGNRFRNCYFITIIGQGKPPHQEACGAFDAPYIAMAGPTTVLSGLRQRGRLPHLYFHCL